MLAQWVSLAGKKRVDKSNEFNQNLRRSKKEQKSDQIATPGSVRAYVQEEEMAQRMRILEEELTKSRKENIFLQSERATWDTQTKLIEDRLHCYQKESEHVLFVLKHEKELISNAEQQARAMVHTLSEKLYHFKIKEEARVAEQIKQEEYIQVLENECAMVKEELQEERKLVQMLKREIDEATQFAKRQAEETGKNLVNALNAAAAATTRAAAAENKCAKANEDLQEERKLVQMLKLELDEATQSAKKQAEETGQGLVNALNAAVALKSLADAAESRFAAIEKKHTKAKKELQEEQDLVQMLKLELDEATQFSNRQAEEMGRQLVNALNAAAAAESRAAAAEAKIYDLERKIMSTADKVVRRLRTDSLSKNPTFSYDLVCAICLTNEKDLAFGCGQMTCQDRGSKMSNCPICREKITSRVKLFPG